MASIISTYLLDEVVSSPAAAGVDSVYVLDEITSPSTANTESLYSLNDSVTNYYGFVTPYDYDSSDVINTSLIYNLSYLVDPNQNNSHNFNLPYRYQKYIPVSSSFNLRYSILLDDSNKIFQLRYRSNTDTTSTSYNFLARYQFGLVGNRNLNFRLAYALDTIFVDRRNKNFNLRYKVEKVRDLRNRLFQAKYEVTRFIPDTSSFTLPYISRKYFVNLTNALELESVDGIYSATANIDTSYLADTTLIIVDNGSKYNKYIVETDGITNQDDGRIRLTYTSGNLEILIRNLEKEAQLNITLTDENLVELAAVFGSIITPMYDAKMFVQSTNYIKIGVAQPDECCINKKINLDDETVCSLPANVKMSESTNALIIPDGDNGISIPEESPTDPCLDIDNNTALQRTDEYYMGLSPITLEYDWAQSERIVNMIINAQDVDSYGYDLRIYLNFINIPQTGTHCGEIRITLSNDDIGWLYGDFEFTASPDFNNIANPFLSDSVQTSSAQATFRIRFHAENGQMVLVSTGNTWPGS